MLELVLLRMLVVCILCSKTITSLSIANYHPCHSVLVKLPVAKSLSVLETTIVRNAPFQYKERRRSFTALKSSTSLFSSTSSEPNATGDNSTLLTSSLSTSTSIDQQQIEAEEIVQNQNQKKNNNNNNNDNEITSVQSILLLNIVAVIWGTQHSFIKMAVEDCDASSFTFSRFALAAAIATIGPLILNNNNTKNTSADDNNTKNDMNMSNEMNDATVTVDVGMSADVDAKENQTAWRWGIEMGVWMLLGYAFQAIGLEVGYVLSSIDAIFSLLISHLFNYNL